MKSKFILTGAAFIFLTSLSFTAKAEYYMVYPAADCGSCCSSGCGGTPVVYMHFKSPRAHTSFGAMEMSEYGWIPSPNGPNSATRSSRYEGNCDPY